jgi:transposase
MKKIRRKKKVGIPRSLKRINHHAAGVDVGSRFHAGAVPPGSSKDGRDVQFFDTFTVDLERLVNWFAECGVDTVAMESTGVYWIPLYEMLEERGFDVLLVDTRQVKYVPGRKTDYLDSQWIQELHSFGLLRGAFRPDDQICQLRAYVRQRAMLISESSRHIQHIQKALEQMNVKLVEVLRDVTGKTGMKIIDAILNGEHDPEVLAAMRDRRCKHDEQTIAKALRGHWRDEHLFALHQAVDRWRFHTSLIDECHAKIEEVLGYLPDLSDDQPLPAGGSKPKRRNDLNFDGRAALYQVTGVDLTAIEGIEEVTALTVISEIGTDMSRWENSHKFASWLALCPGNNKTGGYNRSGRNRRSTNRAAQAFRLAANGLWNSKSALGSFLRRMAARRGKSVAIKATAHKLAKIVYSMLRYGTEYAMKSQDYYEQMYRERRISNLKRHAKDLGFELVTPQKAA